MKIESLSIDLLKPYPGNPRVHGETQIKEMARSIERFGQIRPVIVDENNVILAGHCIWLAMQYLKRSECFALRKKGLSEAEKTKLLLADNKVAELGFTNYDKVMELLETLGNDLDIPGFDETALNKLVSDADDVLKEYGVVTETKQEPAFFDVAPDRPQAAPTPPQERATEEPVETTKIIKCPNCGEVIKL